MHDDRLVLSATDVTRHVGCAHATSLEREVLEAVRRWRFNALPGRAPQVDQRGTVTFRFTV